MTSSLCRNVLPIFPRIFRSLRRIDSRLCSSESQGPDDKRSSNASVPSTLTEKADDLLSPVPVSVSSKYITFTEDNAPIILDVEEEKIIAQQASSPKDPLDEIFARISKKRGKEGVFDLDELVEVLKLSRAMDLCAISVPSEAKYADYMLIVSGKSPRHMFAIAEFVRRVYKRKRHSEDHIPKIEGKTCKNWMALDLGNIVVHIFSHTARAQYDLESLWSVGYELDPNSKKQYSIVSLLQEHSRFLDHLQPAA